MLLLELLKNSTSLVAPPLTTTMTISDEGNNDDLATTTAVSYVVTSIAANAYANQENVKVVQDTLVYVESMSEEELAQAERLIMSKELEFEIPSNINEEKPKIYIKQAIGKK